MIAPSFRFKRIVLEDLKSIVRHIAANNPAAARKFRDELYEKFEFLAQNPVIAPERSDLAPNLRYLPYGNYLLFYLPERVGVTIVCVFHGVRRIAPELFAPATG